MPINREFDPEVLNSSSTSEGLTPLPKEPTATSSQPKLSKTNTHTKISRGKFLLLTAGTLAAGGSIVYSSQYTEIKFPHLAPTPTSTEQPTLTPEYELYFGERLLEQQKWEKVLGIKVEVDPLPTYLTTEVVEKLKEYGLHIRYFPELTYNNRIQVRAQSPVQNTLGSASTNPNWQSLETRQVNNSTAASNFQGLDPKFWEEVTKGTINNPHLPGQWAAVEIMPKPDINIPYPESFFTFDKGYKRRVQISPTEVNKFLDWTKKATLKNLGLISAPPIQLRLLEAVEWNLLANREQWPNNSSGEWTQTKYAHKDQIIVGVNGNSKYQFNSPNASYPFWGYRVGMFFSKNNTEPPQPHSYLLPTPPYTVLQGVKKPTQGEITSIKYGEYLFDEDDMKRTFIIDISSDKIPPIPFSKTELKEAEKRGEYLIFRSDKNEKGEPLTIQTMSDLRRQEIVKNFGGNRGFSSVYLSAEDLLKYPPPRPGWALVSSLGLAGSDKLPYMAQTQILADLIPSLHPDKQIPSPLKDALDEFNRLKDEINGLFEANPKEAARRLTSLRLNQLLRISPSEYMYDLFIYSNRNMLTRFDNGFSWTNQVTSSGEIVSIKYDTYHRAFFQSSSPLSTGKGLILSRYKM